MNTVTRVTIEADAEQGLVPAGFTAPGIPTIERRSGRVFLVHGPHRVDLADLPVDAEVSLNLVDDAEAGDIARVVRTTTGVFVSSGFGDTVFRFAEPDTRNLAFAAFAIELRDGQRVLATHPLFDENQAELAGRRHLDRIDVLGATAHLRKAPRLPPRRNDREAISTEQEPLS